MWAKPKPRQAKAAARAPALSIKTREAAPTEHITKEELMKAEARKVNEFIINHGRRDSKELVAEESSNKAGVTRKKRISREGLVSPKEVDEINRKVKEAQQEMARRRVLLEEEKASKRAAKQRAAELDDANHGVDADNVQPVAQPTTPTKKKWGLARERLAAMQKESDERKMALGILPGPPDAQGSGAQGSHAARVGAAQAAAKLAGGVFYSMSENATLFEKLRGLKARNEQLEARCKALEATVAAADESAKRSASPHASPLGYAYLRAAASAAARSVSGRGRRPSVGDSVGAGLTSAVTLLMTGDSRDTSPLVPIRPSAIASLPSNGWAKSKLIV